MYSCKWTAPIHGYNWENLQTKENNKTNNKP